MKDVGSPLAMDQDQDGPRLMTVDVFDTLLYRRPICERRRISRFSGAVVRHPAFSALGLSQEGVAWARTHSQRLAFRVAAVEDERKEICLDDVLSRIVVLLGLPPGSNKILETLEIDEDIESVVPNQKLIRHLRSLRSTGQRVVALSDTWYSAIQLRRILAAHGCLEALDTVYTSADLGYTKRNGHAFVKLSEREDVPPAKITHLGDDAIADFAAPSKHGVASRCVPRSTLYKIRRTVDAITFIASQRRITASRRHSIDSENLGDILGPIVAEYCVGLWLYMSSMKAQNAHAVFCARGGLRMQIAYEIALERLGLPAPLPFGSLMVSRLIAARGALLKGSHRAYEEIGREFPGATCATVAQALCGTGLEFSSAWDSPFNRTTFQELLEKDALGSDVTKLLKYQNDLFARHLNQVTASADRILLCDTGLFGSTQRMLEDAFPDKQWESALFARCNYKKFDSSHFGRVTGISVQRDIYSPMDVRSCVLRYWHLIEALFEPPLNSVKSFHLEIDGSVRSNLEVDGWRTALEPDGDDTFGYVVRYLSTLSPGDLSRIAMEAPSGWSALRVAILFPSPDDVQLLTVHNRSIDFGRDKEIESGSNSGSPLRISTLKSALWKEGLIASELGALRWPALKVLELAYGARSILSSLRARKLLPFGRIATADQQ